MIRKLLCLLGFHDWYIEKRCSCCEHWWGHLGCMIDAKYCNNKIKRCKRCGKTKYITEEENE